MPGLNHAQQNHWQSAYDSHPHIYGSSPPTPPGAAELFRSAEADTVLELGAGHGRDNFARSGLNVRAADFSPTGLDQLRNQADADGLTKRVTTTVHDVRDPLPLADGSVDGALAQMIACMALSTTDIHRLVGEIHRVLTPGGTLYTGDAHYQTGIAHGERARRFRRALLPRELVDELADSWHLREVHPFEEGDLPRRLWRITQTVPLV